MGGKAGDLLALMTDVLLTARLDDKTRFAQMVAETKAGLEAGAFPPACCLLLLATAAAAASVVSALLARDSGRPLRGRRMTE